MVTDVNVCARDRLSGDKQRNNHCVRSSATMCDLSGSLTDLDLCYTADVLSTPPLGATTDLIEFPHASSQKFCPLKDSKWLLSNSCQDSSVNGGRAALDLRLNVILRTCEPSYFW